jgi:hypothetical protein
VISYIVVPRQQAASFDTIDAAVTAAETRAQEESGREFLVAETRYRVRKEIRYELVVKSVG